MTTEIKYGLRLEHPHRDDRVLGTVKAKEVLQPNGQWDQYMPLKEVQRSRFFETSACVTFSALNCLEVLFYRKYGVQANFSDRFTAKASGTIPDVGNYLRSVAESIKNDGVVIEEKYGWDREGIKTVQEYYQELPATLRTKAKMILSNYQLDWSWAATTQSTGVDLLVDALRYSPLQVTLYAWDETNKKDGIYQRVSRPHTHAVTLYGYELGRYWKILDHYDNEFKKVAWDYEIGSPVAYSVDLLYTTLFRERDQSLRRFNSDYKTAIKYMTEKRGFKVIPTQYAF